MEAPLDDPDVARDVVESYTQQLRKRSTAMAAASAAHKQESADSHSVTHRSSDGGTYESPRCASLRETVASPAAAAAEVNFASNSSSALLPLLWCCFYLC